MIRAVIVGLLLYATSYAQVVWEDNLGARRVLSWEPANAPEPPITLFGASLRWDGEQWVEAPTEPIAVPVWSQVFSNGVLFIGEDSHHYHLTTSNNVLVVTKVSDSPLNVAVAKERIASNVAATAARPPAASRDDVDAAIVAVAEAFNARLPANNRINVTNLLQQVREQRRTP